ncbi:type I-G CRISPR-associated helicase/endonuclease Cas3g [Thermogemmata fonticola]|uniref:DEAD/DEAH box helicase n=1 Tax=Thermogemmata fonticola TaxID=2755323 RepID=A0A7V9AA53_9BACT|nr:DEAD/DEAH box helicase [Thermogemmata fonticola]MBA2224688.1 DEAD/DEAH box helicase [Thermogemmata fonticola]
MSAITPTTFEAFFLTATGVSPYKYQSRLAAADPLPEVLDVPTGLGKTAAVILAWLWRRTSGHPSSPVPRRLVYCLPMRTLVTQTAEAASRWTHNLSEANLLAEPCRVHVLMGGEQADDWDLHPEKNAVIVGTQDMLLSRLLNRGYGMSRYRWPMHFGLLGNDCLWVMDEVQLMGSGLATTVQVDAFQKRFWRPLLPCHFLWMSATLGESLLRTKDREDLDLAKIDPKRLFSLEEPEKQEPAVRQRLAAEKTIEVRKDPPPLRKRDGSGVLDRHQPGRISLLILNTVPVAQDWFRQVQAAIATGANGDGDARPAAILLHSRFRPPDRQRHMASLQRFVERQGKETGAVNDHPGLILVSTQVIEAGIDISGVRLWSEIAPWPSDVQRLGRLNREGRQDGAAATFWMPGSTDENDKGAPNESKKKRERIGPYFRRDLEAARKLLESVRQLMEQDGERRPYREALDAVLKTEESRQGLEVEYEAVIRPHDFLDLFATEPDLAGGFTDVSRFVRDQDRNVDAYVFWRDARTPERSEPAPMADELCPVPFYSLQQFLGAKGTAREWDAESGQWITRWASEVRPGMTLRLWQKQGGYDPDLGWTGNPADVPTVHQPATVSVPDKLTADGTSESHGWLSLADHTADVMAETNELVEAFELSDRPEGMALSKAAPWHDVGKASVRWKNAIDQFLASLRPKVAECRQKESDPQVQGLLDQFAALLAVPGDDCWAKFPDIKWLLGQPDLPAERKKGLRKSLYTPFQPRFRHEAASALVAWKAWREGTAPSLSGLAVYLVACHHGKVRTVLRSIRGTDAVFGIREGEELSPVDGLIPASTPIPTEPRRFGASGQWDDEGGRFRLASTSWVSLVEDLLGTLPKEHEAAGDGADQEQPDALGPFKLAFLEMLFRVADARASARPGKGRNR